MPALVSKVTVTLEANYILEDLVPAMSRALRSAEASGAYLHLDAEQLAARVTSDLRSVADDKHLRLKYAPVATASTPGGQRQDERNASRYGVKSVEVLCGNVGYLRLDGFADPAKATPAIAAAMELLSGTRALVLDLRHNGGGGQLITLLTSYLVDDNPQLMQTVEYPRRGQVLQFWTESYVPGQRYLERPVYVLTSAQTFSAAEAFTYNLQAIQRAKVVGEVTGGGANPNMMARISPDFVLSVPIGRTVNATTHGNWEGRGVTPDRVVPAAEALAAALRELGNPACAS